MDYQEIKSMLAHNEALATREAIREQTERQQIIAEQTERDATWNKINETATRCHHFADFKQELVKSFITEALVVFIDNCLSQDLIVNESNLQMIRQLTTNFVNETGTSLLGKMRRTSNLMSELAYNVDKAVEFVLENVDKNNDATFKIPQESKSKFYEGLEKVDADVAIGKISERVRTQTTDFMNANLKEKAELSSVMDKTKNKVNEAKKRLSEKAQTEENIKQAEAQQEAYIQNGKRRMTEIESSRSKNILEQMIYTLSKSALTNESAKAVFVEDSKLNMDLIVERCEVLCTFITALDSTKLINLDEDYIIDMLEGLKK